MTVNIYGRRIQYSPATTYEITWKCAKCGAVEELHPDPDGWLPPECCQQPMHIAEGD